jgi:hypothetical protein
MIALKNYSFISTRLILLLILVFSSICVFALPTESLNIVSKVKPDVLVSGSDLYWAILLNTLYVFIVIPFVFIAYQGIKQIPNELEIYLFRGDYNAENIIKYIESFENRFGKKYTNFKKSIEKCSKDSGVEIENHSETIDNNLFCIKLNGRKRLQVFWDCSDWFLKTFLLSLPIIGIILIVISYHYFNLTGLILSMVSLLIIIPLYLIFISSMLSFFRYIFRILHREQPALSITKFALESIINFNVKRAFDNKKREYFYYSTIHMYNNEVNANAFQRKDYIDPNPFTINGVIDDYSLQE